jgi:thioredoxin-related protein
MRTLRVLTTATLAWSLASSLFAADELWVNQFDKAKTTAAKDGKDLLLDFTGSDWCSWCIKLHKEVFDLEAFKNAAPKKFVLVELDFPQDKSKLSKEVQDQNAALQKQFSIRGYPTIVLADAQGRPYAQTGYQPGGADAYVKHLDELQQVKVKRDTAWKKAEGAKGAEKAKLLAEGLKALDTDLAATHYKPVIDEITKLDPADETGVGGAMTFKSDLAAMNTKLQGGETPDGAAARKAANEFITAHPKITPQQKQETLLGLLNFYRPPKDNETVLKLMEEVKALDPASDSGQRANDILESVKKMIEQAKEKPAPATEAPPKKGS